MLRVEAALKDLQEALKGADVDAIKAKEAALMKAMEPIASAMYAQQGAAGAQGAGPHTETDRTTATIRDLFNDSFSNVYVNDEKIYEEVRRYPKKCMN